MRIVVFGMGYVGLVTAAQFANAGHRVWGVEKDSEKLRLLKAGKAPFHEPGLQELLENTANISFSESLKTSKPWATKTETNDEPLVVFVCVGTPQKENGSAETSEVFNCIDELVKDLDEPALVILKSTVPVGTAHQVKQKLAPINDLIVSVVSNPEFTRQGQAVSDFASPDRVVIGCEPNKSVQQNMQHLYSQFSTAEKMLFMKNESAEMCKYAANSFLATKISFANELSELCQKLGADMSDVVDGFASDFRINPSFFGAGLGFGGSCFPKDLAALTQLGEQKDLPMRIVRAVSEVNELQPQKFFKRIKAEFSNLSDKTFAVWGLSFKAGTDDQRRSPAHTVISYLLQEGAKVKCYDPKVTELEITSPNIEFCKTKEIALENSEALLTLTDWPEFQEIELSEVKLKLKTPLIFDGRNLFKTEELSKFQIKHIKL